MSGPNERDEIAALRTALANLIHTTSPVALDRVDSDFVADSILASEWLAERDRRTAATAVASVVAAIRSDDMREAAADAIYDHRWGDDWESDADRDYAAAMLARVAAAIEAGP